MYEVRIHGRGGQGAVTAAELLSIAAFEGGSWAQAFPSFGSVERMELDEDGFPRPTGEVEVLDADTVVLALGQEVALDLLAELPDVRVERGVVTVDDNRMTGRSGVFAGGDMTPGDRTATTAVGPSWRRTTG